MPRIGPLTNVATLTAGISLDVQRKLTLPKGVSLRFIVPDTAQLDNWRTVRQVTKGFNRISEIEETRGDASSVVFQIAATKRNQGLDITFRLKDLSVEFMNVIYGVAEVPSIAPNEAQVYTVTCKKRTLRDRFFDNKK